MCASFGVIFVIIIWFLGFGSFDLRPWGLMLRYLDTHKMASGLHRYRFLWHIKICRLNKLVRRDKFRMLTKRNDLISQPLARLSFYVDPVTFRFLEIGADNRARQPCRCYLFCFWCTRNKKWQLTVVGDVQSKWIRRFWQL